MSLSMGTWVRNKWSPPTDHNFLLTILYLFKCKVPFLYRFLKHNELTFSDSPTVSLKLKLCFQSAHSMLFLNLSLVNTPPLFFFFFKAFTACFYHCLILLTVFVSFISKSICMWLLVCISIPTGHAEL